MNNFARVAQWLQACGKEPGNPEHLSAQIGAHFEECAEFLREVTIESTTGITSSALQEVAAILDAIGRNLLQGHAKAVIHDREMALDALCDSDVTGNGVAYLAGMKKDLADLEVLRSNDSKLVDGKALILPGGKIGKPETYSPADLTPFI
jgi:hypothetical protein